MNQVPLLRTFLWRFDLKTGVVFIGVTEVIVSSAVAVHSVFNLFHLDSNSFPRGYWHRLVLCSFELGYGLAQWVSALVLLLATRKGKPELIVCWFYTHLLFIVFVTLEGLLLALLDSLYALLLVLFNLALFGYFIVIVTSYYKIVLMGEDEGYNGCQV